MSFSNYLENELLDHVFGGAAYTAPATLYVALYTAAPSDAGGGTEVSGGSYARTAITFGAASGGTISNNANCEFPTATADWGTITHVGIHDAASAGNLIDWGALTVSKSILSGDIFRIQTGEYDISLD